MAESQFLRRAALEQVTARAGAQRLEDAVGVLVDRHHDDLDRGQQLLEPGGAFDAGDVRQLNVHQHDLRLMFGE